MTRLLLAWLALAGALLVALGLWQGQGYWEYSDGVYALSARQTLDGLVPYRDFAAAQPPPLYYAGALALAIADTPAAIRIAMALCAACTSLLVLVAVLRLTRSRPAALCAAAACLLTPWALREHAQLVPETLVAPLLMGAALAAGAGGRRASLAAGILAAAAVMVKLAFVAPALAIVLAARERRRALAGFAAAAALCLLAFALLFGEPLWTNAVRAQAQTGRAALDYVAGLWAQAGWNLVPLAVLAALAWPRRAAIADRDLARCLLAAALGALLALATLVKQGSYLTAVVVAEPPLLCLAATGLVLTLRARPVARAQAAVLAAALALGLAQVGSLLLAPADPVLFTRPFAASGPARVLSDGEVGAIAAQIRAGCPPSGAYPGPPYLAFVAGRRSPGAQPDQFIVERAPVLARFRRAVAADAAVCTSAPVPREAAGRGR